MEGEQQNWYEAIGKISPTTNSPKIVIFLLLEDGLKVTIGLSLPSLSFTKSPLISDIFYKNFLQSVN